MNLRRTCAVCATAIGLALASSVAAPQMAGAGTQDRVTGSASLDWITAELRVNAHSGPQGENPSGTITGTFPFERRQAKVSCMIVNDTWAVVGGLDQNGADFYVIIQDNGASGDVVNYAAGSEAPKPGQAQCALVLSRATFFSPISGDFTVVDS